MFIQPISSNFNRHPSFGQMKLDEMSSVDKKAIMENSSLQRLSKELDKEGCDLNFKYIWGYDAICVSMMVDNESIDLIAGKMCDEKDTIPKQLKEYDADKILKGIHIAKKLFKQ